MCTKEPSVFRAVSCVVRVCLSAALMRECWLEKSLTPMTRKTHFQVIGESEAFCLNLQLQTHPVKDAYSLNIFCFCEMFDFLKWSDNATAMLDFAYWPVSGSYRPHLPPLTCGTVRRADRAKSPFMNRSVGELMAFKGLWSLQQR